RRHAPALVRDHIAAGNLAVLSHHVQAQGRVRSGAHVPVRGGALPVVAAPCHGGRGDIVQERLLGHHVDGAGGGGAAVFGAVGSLGDLDLLDVEGVTRDRAHVAHAVHEDAAGGVETAHVDVVTGRGGAGFSGVEGAHAGAVPQGLGEGGGALLPEEVAGDDLQGLGRVEQRLRELGRSGFGAVFGRRERGDLHLRQRPDLVWSGTGVGGAGSQGGSRQSQGKSGHDGGGEGSTVAKAGRALDRVFAALDEGHGCPFGGKVGK